MAKLTPEQKRNVAVNNDALGWDSRKTIQETLVLSNSESCSSPKRN